jgi:hypothetical protein
MTRESAIERAEWQIPHDLARHVVFRTESQVRESRPPLGIYFERGTAPAFRRMGYATEILLYDRLGSWMAVGMPITGHPPHGSGQARFEHPAPTLGV